MVVWGMPADLIRTLPGYGPDTTANRAEARKLYEDLTPAPTSEEIEIRRLERIYRAAMTPPRAPDKRQRRALRKMKGRD